MFIYLPSSKFYHFSFQKGTKGDSEQSHRLGQNICKHISKKGLVSRLQKPFSIQQQEDKQPNQKMGKHLNISSKSMYDSK